MIFWCERECVNWIGEGKVEANCGIISEWMIDCHHWQCCVDSNGPFSGQKVEKTQSEKGISIFECIIDWSRSSLWIRADFSPKRKFRWCWIHRRRLRCDPGEANWISRPQWKRLSTIFVNRNADSAFRHRNRRQRRNYVWYCVSARAVSTFDMPTVFSYLRFDCGIIAVCRVSLVFIYVFGFWSTWNRRKPTNSLKPSHSQSWSSFPVEWLRLVKTFLETRWKKKEVKRHSEKCVRNDFRFSSWLTIWDPRMRYRCGMDGKTARLQPESLNYL